MKPIRAIIIDDELAAIKVLQALLRQFAPDVELLGIATDGLQAVQTINQHKPDLVFLDVDMPVMNGLQVMEIFPTNAFEVIFTTGSSEYAFKALKMKAIDYLLKPIDPAEFIMAVEGARKQLLLREKENPHANTRIQLPTQNGFIFLDEEDIIHVTGMGSYCQLHTVKNEKVTVSRNIGQMEQKLSPDHFFRCHNSHIINLDYVTRFLHKDGYLVEMENGALVDVSRRNKEKLLQTLADRAK